MALALYRKYRPATFAEVVGQEHVTEPLMQALSSGRINHAYLFSGPRGCGKTSSARILARSLNCVQGPTPTPCGECDSCVALAPDGPGSLDVIEIDAASHGGVDDARDLRERAFFAPVNSRYKVYIVDEAHMVSTQGFNALLKLVEEPPEFLVFVFATTEPEKVLPTIRSRTHHYPFRLLPPGLLRGLLERICASEDVAVEPAVYPLVTRAGGGSARDSLSVMDQLLAGAGPAGVTYQHALGLLGVTDAAMLDELIDALAANDRASAFELIDRLVEAGHDPRRFAVDLLERLRDLILLEAVPEAANKQLVDGPADQLQRMGDQAAKLGAATLSRCADVVHDGLTDMRGTTAPRLLLELICARMLLPGASDDVGSLHQRLDRLERRASITEPAAPERRAAPERPAPAPDRRPAAPAAEPPVAESRPAESQPESRAVEPERPAEPERRTEPERPASERPTESEPATPPSMPPPPASTPEPVTPAAGGTFDVAAVRRIWPDVLDAMKGKSRRTHALMLNGTVSALDGDTLVLAMSSAPLARLVSEESNLSQIRAALHSVLGVDWRVRAGIEGEASANSAGPIEPRPEPTPPVAAAPPPPEEDPRDESGDDEPGENSPRQDSEAAALSLLQGALGARTVDPEN
ncbi:MAG TPA: DNA polymerase III subunit gamma and tau [Mycobacteriales bacterium]|nr:DNA polymerase III subunit gamma and tau [Mycobacteriales bacterium]